MANRRARRDEMTAQLNEDVFLAGVVNEAHALVYLQSVDTRSAIKAVERELTGILGHIGDDNARRHPSFIPEERPAYTSVDDLLATDNSGGEVREQILVYAKSLCVSYRVDNSGTDRQRDAWGDKLDEFVTVDAVCSATLGNPA